MSKIIEMKLEIMVLIKEVMKLLNDYYISLAFRIPFER